jgi:deoxyadenosine/deoxycytidine kinase
MMVVTVSVSGSVGVGKSTLAQGLAKRLPRAKLVPERVGELHYLPLFYADRTRYALHSRLEFLLVKARQLAGVDSADGIAIFDRSMPELITFARALNASGEMPDDDLELYVGLYHLMTSLVRPIDLVIWTRAAPETMLARIRARGRSFEQGITSEYLDRIDKEYERWFASLPSTSRLVVDTSSLDSEEVADIAASWVRDITT